MAKKAALSMVLTAILTACSQAGTPAVTEAPVAPPTMDMQAVSQAVESTVAAELTRIAIENPSPTIPAPTDTETPSPTATTAPTATISPLALDDHAMFVADITIPDGTEIVGGEPFTKTWRLQNIGLNSWTTDYSFVFVAGELMEGFPVFLEEEVPPGGMIDISITMIAPLASGIYEGYWMLADADGNVFGIGEEANQAVLVSIIAIEPTPLPTETSTPTEAPTATSSP